MDDSWVAMVDGCLMDGIRVMAYGRMAGFVLYVFQKNLDEMSVNRNTNIYSIDTQCLYYQQLQKGVYVHTNI